MSGYGYGLLILALIILAVVTFVAFIGGLIYARRTLGRRRGSGSTYTGWYLFYTARFMARVAAAIGFGTAGWGTRYEVLTLPAAAFVMFPSLWWKVLSLVTGREQLPVTKMTEMSPADRAGDATTAGTLWAFRAHIMIRAALPWAAGITAFAAIGLLNYSPRLPFARWWHGLYWELSGWHLPTTMLVCFVATVPAAAIAWLLWWKRERTYFDEPPRSLVIAVLPLVLAAAITWVVGVLVLFSVAGFDERLPFIDRRAEVFALMVVGHAAATAVLVIGGRIVPPIDRAATPAPAEPIPDDYREPTTESAAVPARRTGPSTAFGVGLLAVAVIGVVALAVREDRDDRTRPMPLYPTAAPTVAPPPTLQVVASAVPTTEPPSTVPPETVTTTTQEPPEPDAPPQTAYHLAVTEMRAEVERLVLDAHVANVQWEHGTAEYEQVRTLLEQLIADVSAFRSRLESLKPRPPILAGHTLLSEAAERLTEASDGMLEGLLLPRDAEDVPGTKRRASLFAFREAVFEFDRIALRVSDPATPIMLVDGPPPFSIFDPRDGESVAGAVLTLAGTAPPGTIIQWNPDATDPFTTEAGADGAWVLPVELRLGPNIVTVLAADPAGDAITVVEFGVTRAVEISLNGIEGVRLGDPVDEATLTLAALLGTPTRTVVAATPPDFDPRYDTDGWYSKTLQWLDLEFSVVFDNEDMYRWDGAVGLGGWETTNAQFRTREGIGVGSTMGEVRAAYGDRIVVANGPCTRGYGFFIDEKPGGGEIHILWGELDGPSSDPGSRVTYLAAGWPPSCPR